MLLGRHHQARCRKTTICRSGPSDLGIYIHKSGGTVPLVWAVITSEELSKNVGASESLIMAKLHKADFPEYCGFIVHPGIIILHSSYWHYPKIKQRACLTVPVASFVSSSDSSFITMTSSPAGGGKAGVGGGATANSSAFPPLFLSLEVLKIDSRKVKMSTGTSGNSHTLPRFSRRATEDRRTALM
jgi:hypothetical protein